MRTVEVSLDGTVYAMPVTMAALRQLAERGIDPFRLSSAMTKGVMLEELQSIETIVVGARLAGCKLDADQIGQAIIDEGPLGFLKVASAYLIAVAEGGPAVPIVGSKKKQGKQGRDGG